MVQRRYCTYGNASNRRKELAVTRIAAKPRRVLPSIREVSEGPLPAEELRLINAYWRAANYLSVGQIYLYDNPLLKKALSKNHIKPRLLGHWGTTPGLNFIYAHLNRVIKRDDLNMIYIIGP